VKNSKEDLIARYRHYDRLLADESLDESQARSLRASRDALAASIDRIERVEGLEARLTAVTATRAPGWRDAVAELRRQIKAVKKTSA